MTKRLVATGKKVALLDSAQNKEGDMSISLIAYLVAIALFMLAALTPSRGWFVPIGLACFALGHILAGVSFKAV